VTCVDPLEFWELEGRERRFERKASRVREVQTLERPAQSRPRELQSIQYSYFKFDTPALEPRQIFLSVGPHTLSRIGLIKLLDTQALAQPTISRQQQEPCSEKGHPTIKCLAMIQKSTSSSVKR